MYDTEQLAISLVNGSSRCTYIQKYTFTCIYILCYILIYFVIYVYTYVYLYTYLHKCTMYIDVGDITN